MKKLSFRSLVIIEIFKGVIKYFLAPIVFIALAYFTWEPAIVISWLAILGSALYIGFIFSDIKHLFVFIKLNKKYSISKKSALELLISEMEMLKGTGTVDDPTIAAMRAKDLDRQFRIQSFGQKIDSKRGVRMGKMASSSGASQRKNQNKYQKLYVKLSKEIESEKPKSEFY